VTRELTGEAAVVVGSALADLGFYEGGPTAEFGDETPQGAGVVPQDEQLREPLDRGLRGRAHARMGRGRLRWHGSDPEIRLVDATRRGLSRA